MTSIIPFYFILKLAFYVFLFHPSTQGATVMYEKVLLPNIKPYEQKIDDAAEKLADEVKNRLKWINYSLVYMHWYILEHK